MGWWPFSSKNSESSETLDLEPDIQIYYDNIVDAKTSDNIQSSHRSRDDVDVTALSRAGNNRKHKTVKQIALDNCVEYERAYSKCLINGSYFERFTSCSNELTMYDKCKDMQIKALTVLGYNAATDNEQRKSIKMKADDLMIKAVPSLTITTSQDERFSQLLEEETK